MTATAVACAVLSGAAVLALGPSRAEGARTRLVNLHGTLHPPTADPRRIGPPGSGTGPRASRRPTPALTAVVVLTCLAAAVDGAGDPVLVVGALTAGGAATWFARRRDRTALQRRLTAMVVALPTTADLLATCLTAGASPADALGTVAETTTGPLADRLRKVSGGLRLGADPTDAWGLIEPGDPIAPLARAFIRSSATGAAIAPIVAAIADEQRRAARWAAEARARRAGVLAVGPLAACFLPAFVLIGVVPVIVAVAGEVLGGLR